jgi:hypothetical protein
VTSCIGKDFGAKSLAPAERLRLLGSGWLGMLVLRMADASVVEARDSTGISAKSRRLMRFDGTLRRVAAGRGFASPEGQQIVLTRARRLLDSWHFAAAASACVLPFPPCFL